MLDLYTYFYNKQLLLRRCGCPTLITNFKKEQEPIYREAIEKSGKDFLYIKEDAYWIDGTYDESLSALWSRKWEDLSDFWRIFESLYDAKEYEERLWTEE